jgi:cytochrome bd ubiquinol oxidase subunit II
MRELFSTFGLPELVAAIMVLALNAYVVMAGADFGGGVWDLLATGPRRENQRALIASSIGPVWEANHVWLIVVVVMLFTAFPVAFSVLGTLLHIPLTLMLMGIVMRGSAFVFRSYGSRAPATRNRWGVAFAIASLVTPVVLGMVIGAIASGKIADAVAALGRAGTFHEIYIKPWFGVFPLAVGVFALALFAFLAAVYLTLEARDEPLREDFRNRALGAAAAVFVSAGLALLVAQREAPRVAAGVSGAPWSMTLHLCTAAAAITAIVTLWQRAFRVARVAAVAQVSFILWGWALSQYPYILPERLTIADAAAPPITLRLLLIGLGVGSAILIPSLRYLFKTFAGRAADL